MSVVTDAYVATTPVRYWPLDETSGTNANELIANEDGTASGMTMGGTDVHPGIGGKAPLFTGTGHILLRSAAILGGLASWSVAAWVQYGVEIADENGRFWYGEASTGAGNDLVGVGVNGATSAGLQLAYGDDSNAPITRTSSVVYIRLGWAFVVMTRSGATIEGWWNLGRRMVRSDAVATSTWTNANITTRLGAPQDLTAWKGSVAHIALYDRVLSAADQTSIYNACTPLTRTLPTRKFFRANAIWNQKLTVPGNAPTIAANSAATVAALVAQANTYGAGSNTSTGPFFTATAGEARERVRLAGGQNNFSYNHPDLWNAMGDVPIPDNFTIPLVSDREGQIYAEDSDELWEFFVMEKTLAQPLGVFKTVLAGGTIPAGTYDYSVAGAKADGTYGKWSFVRATVDGTQKVSLTWGEVEGCDHYRVFRSAVGSAQPWRKIANVASGTLAYMDDGSAGWPPPDLPTVGTDTPTAVTTDWGCTYGGYIDGTDDNVGIYEPPHNNWGASATSLPLWGGTVSIVEAQALDIDHAIAMALPEIDVTGYVYPAQRNDGWFVGGNSVKEGTRFQLDPGYNLEWIPFLFDRAVAAAFQEYGGYVRDVSNEVSVYMEDQHGAGRDFEPKIFEGRHSYELFDGFPWSSMRVIDPAWTEAQTTMPPTPAGHGHWGVLIQ